MSRDVVFDLGGVVFRWEPLVLLQQLFPQRMPDEASARHWAGQIFQTFAPEADWALFDLGRIEPEALAQRIARRTGLSEQELQQLIDGIPPHLTPMQGTVDLIHDLKAAGHRLYFLSNMPSALCRPSAGGTSFFCAVRARHFFGACAADQTAARHLCHRTGPLAAARSACLHRRCAAQHRRRAPPRLAGHPL